VFINKVLQGYHNRFSSKRRTGPHWIRMRHDS
jgi:hypothetical protein